MPKVGTLIGSGMSAVSSLFAPGINPRRELRSSLNLTENGVLAASKLPSVNFCSIVKI